MKSLIKKTAALLAISGMMVSPLAMAQNAGYASPGDQYRCFPAAEPVGNLEQRIRTMGVNQNMLTYNSIDYRCYDQQAISTSGSTAGSAAGNAGATALSSNVLYAGLGLIVAGGIISLASGGGSSATGTN